MNNFDRIKIQFSTDFLIDWENYKDNYDPNFKSRKNHTYTLLQKNLKKYLGLNSILYKETDLEDVVDIEFTGKILGKNYHKLISIDTIRECLENIVNTGMINFDIDKVLNYSRVLSLDVTCDVKSPISTEKALEALKYISINEKWYLRAHNHTGITIYYEALSKDFHLNIYDKPKEVRKKYQFFPKDCDIRNFDNIIRFEVQIRDFETLQKYLCVPKVDGYFRLLDVLQSDQKVILNVLDTIEMDESFTISKSHATMTAAEIEKDQHMERVIIEAGYDINKVMSYLKMIKGYRSAAIKKRYINKLNELRSAKFDDKFQVIKEFRELIKKSYSDK